MIGRGRVHALASDRGRGAASSGAEAWSATVLCENGAKTRAATAPSCQKPILTGVTEARSTIAAGVCASQAFISAPNARSSSSSHSISPSPLASILADVHGPCVAVFRRCSVMLMVMKMLMSFVLTLRMDVLIEVLLLLRMWMMLWMMLGRLTVTSACATSPQHEPQREQMHHMRQYSQTERHHKGHQQHHHHARHPVAAKCGAGKRQGTVAANRFTQSSIADSRVSRD